jgi:hypothetical protein
MTTDAQRELARQIEALCRENFVLKMLLQGHLWRWKEMVQKRLYSQEVLSRYQGSIGDDVLASLEQLRIEIDEDVERRF